MPKSIARFLLSAAIGIAGGVAFAQTPAQDALLAKADELSQQGKYDQAIDIATRALAAAEQAFGAGDRRLVKPLRTLARLYGLQSQDAKAAAYYRRALSILKRSAGAGSEEIAEIKAQLALLAANQKREADAGAADGALKPQAWGNRSRSLKAMEAAPPPPPVSAPMARGVGEPAKADSDTVPFFPWPPPASSARYVFPEEVFSRYATVGEVSGTILAALEHTGYVERSFFQTAPGGVALVTRLEKIGGDGAPAPEQDRWPSGFDNTPQGFIDFVRGLFYAKPGHYRVIVFILQEKAFTQSEKKATGKDAETWLAEGAIKLPAWLASRPFGKDSTCTALIYEFESDGTAVKSVVSSLTGKQHLQKAGLLTALSAPN